MSSSSLAYDCGLERLWLGGLFTAAEVAAADLLLQLSVGAGGGDHELAVAASSPRSVMSSCCEDLVTVDAVEEVEGMGLLDRRARKRHRLLSELYAATSPVREPSVAAKKRRRHYYVVDDGESEPEQAVATAMRYGDYYY